MHWVAPFYTTYTFSNAKNSIQLNSRINIAMRKETSNNLAACMLNKWFESWFESPFKQFIAQDKAKGGPNEGCVCGGRGTAPHTHTHTHTHIHRDKDTYIHTHIHTHTWCLECNVYQWVETMTWKWSYNTDVNSWVKQH